MRLSVVVTDMRRLQRESIWYLPACFCISLANSFTLLLLFLLQLLSSNDMRNKPVWPQDSARPSYIHQDSGATNLSVSPLRTSFIVVLYRQNSVYQSSDSHFNTIIVFCLCLCSYRKP